MKFVHIADLHLDMPYINLKGNKELSKKLKLNQKFCLKQVIDYIKEEKVDVLFVAGDLFEQKYVTSDTINYIISCFSKIPNTQIFITPGNHDPLIKSSPYSIYDFPDNVFIFGSEVGKYTIGNVDIYGLGFDNYEMQSEAIKEINVDESKINILITHGTLNGSSKKYHDIKQELLKDFDYVALGHIHMPKVDDSNIIYPGSLTSCGFDEPGNHGMISGTIEDEKLKCSELKVEKAIKKRLVTYKFICLDGIQFDHIEEDISSINSKQELIDKLKIDKNVIYKLKLIGKKSFDTAELIDEIKACYPNIIDIEDETHIEYNFEEASKIDSLKGIFTKKMLEELDNNPNHKEEILEALEYIYSLMS